MRFRHVFLGLGTLFVAIMLTITDPDAGIITDLSFGAPFIATIAILTKAIVYVALAHIARKGLFDYIDLEDYFKKAIEEPIAAGLALVSVGLFFIGIAILVMSATAH